MNQSEPKFIGKRISIRKDKQHLKVEISQQVERWQEAILIAWLAAWFFCGMTFIYFAATSTNRPEQIIAIIATSIWLYFFVRITKVFIWRKRGREVLTFSNGKLTLKNSFGGRGKEESFNFQHIAKLGLVTKDPSSFLAFLDDSFWMIAGDRVGFNYSGQKIRLGKQLAIRDAELLIRVMESAMKEYK